MITKDKFVQYRTEYVDTDGVTLKYRVAIGDTIVDGTMPGGNAEVVSGLSEADASAYTPGLALTATYAPKT